MGGDDEGYFVPAGIDHGACGGVDIVPFIGEGGFEGDVFGIDEGAVGEEDLEGGGGVGVLPAVFYGEGVFIADPDFDAPVDGVDGVPDSGGLKGVRPGLGGVRFRLSGV